MPSPERAALPSWVPAGVVVTILITAVTAAWTIATDRHSALADIAANVARNQEQDGRINRLERDMAYVRSALVRLETKFGTLPTRLPELDTP